jgi:hypothetical protein
MADNGLNVVRVCARADVPPGTVRAFAVGSNTLAVYNIDGAYYVTDDECSRAALRGAALCGDGGFNMLMCEFLTAVMLPLRSKLAADARLGLALTVMRPCRLTSALLVVVGVDLRDKTAGELHHRRSATRNAIGRNYNICSGCFCLHQGIG